MNRADRLKRLQDVAELIADQALVPVADASADVRRIEERIVALADHRTKLIRHADDPATAAAMLSQADRLRLLQAAALRELATARVTLEQARRTAAKAVGRDHALKEISRRQALALRKRQQRSPF